MNFSLDSSDWSLDDTSQDLLNEAIASNYRSQDVDDSVDVSVAPKRSTSKRKPSSFSSSSGEKRGHDKTEDGAKTVPPKRAGRKPLEKSQLPEAPLDPRQKRKEQNRAAQRAFRERKERHVHELQERIRELEEENASHSNLIEENLVLKEQIKQLKEENYALKGTTFTFEYPPKSLPHDEEYRSSNSSSSNSSCGSLSISGSGDKMASSSSSSINSGESPAMASPDDSLEEEHQTTPQDLKSTSTSHGPMLNITDDLFIPGSDTHNFNFFSPSPIVDFNSATFSTTASKLSQQQYQQQQQQQMATPETTATTTTIGTTATPAQHEDLVFTDYRIPPSADGFLFQNDSELPPLFGEELDLFGFSAPAPFVNTDLDSSVQQQDLLTQLADPNFLLHTTQDEQTQAMLQQIQQQQHQGDNQLLQHQQQSGCSLDSLMETLKQAQHEPLKATELSQQVKACCPDFDLDDLCSDLSKKATCSDSVFTPKEVNVIIDYFQHKKRKHPFLQHLQQQ